MAEGADGGKQSGRSKFLSKSKWGKVFKENDAPAAGRVDSFKLSDDVTDFLKPSTDRAASTRPKINIAVAQRWPEAHEVKRAHAERGAGLPVNGWTKPRRREGLVVGFAKTAPEVIGEGGDEASGPPSEVSRMKSKMARSVSDAKALNVVQNQPSMSRPGQYAKDPGLPAGPDDRWKGYSGAFPMTPGLPSHQQQRQPTMRDPRPPSIPDDDCQPPPLRRAQTNNEFSPPLQRQHQSPPLQPIEPHRPSVSRTPNGFREESEQQHAHFDDGLKHDLSASRQTVETNLDDVDLVMDDTGADDAPPRQKRGKYGMLSQSPVGTASPATSRQRDMTNTEGMAFRRASAIYMNSESPINDLNEGFEPSADFYDALSQAPADALADALSPPDSSSPASAISPLGPSPFADPKYTDKEAAEAVPDVKRASDGSSLYPESERSSVSQIGPSPFADPNYIKRRSNEVPAASQSDPFSMLAPEPPPPEAQMRVQPRRGPHQMPFESLRQQRKHDYQPTYMRGGRPNRTNGYVPVAPARPSQDDPVIEAQAIKDATGMQKTHSSSRPTEGTKLTSAEQEPSDARPMQPLSRPGAAVDVAPESTMNMADVGPLMPSRSPLRDEVIASHSDARPDSSTIMYSHPDLSSGSLSRFSQSTASRSPVASHRRQSPRDAEQLGKMQRASTTHQRSPSPSYPTSSGSPNHTGRSSSLLEPVVPITYGHSPDMRNSSPRPADCSSPAASLQVRMANSPMVNLRNEETARPGSAGSHHRATSSPVPPLRGDPGAELALADFAARVAYMKGVFRLTAEKERSADQCTPEAWLRTAVWWYLLGKAGLESLLAQRSQATARPREMLMQPHVDLAKAHWILTDPLEVYDMTESGSPRDAQASVRTEAMRHSVTLLMSYLKSLLASVQKSQLMPPSQSLIQGQDTNIWIDYPRFTANAAAVLGGSTPTTLIAESVNSAPNVLHVLPLGDTKDTFCYTRCAAEARVNTEDADTDRMILRCVVTMVRTRRDYQTSLLVSSQNELINIMVAPKQDTHKGITWRNIAWKANSSMFIVHLPRGLDLAVRMSERDFRSMWNLAEYSHKVENSLRPERDEKLVHEARLIELQYADSSGTSSFPQDKVRGCSALVYERHVKHSDGSGTRKFHRGFRLLLVTGPGHKSLSYASHEVCRRSPLLFEFITDASANGTTAMVLRVKENRRQCRILLVFPNAASRNALYEVLNGLTVGPDETIVGKVKCAGINIEPATQTEGFTPTSHPALHALQWQRLGITNHSSDVLDNPQTVESESLRIISRHAGGCITDRLNLGKGELLIRLPCSDKVRPSVQMLRQPQEDLNISIDTRQCPQQTADSMAGLLRLAQEQETIRTYTFATNDDLHAFQAAITGYTVKYDGIASTFAISRRMMVVSIHHKWQASNVRLQIVMQSSTTKILAFMEDFVHADAICFEVKSMDIFESVKGDNKSKKWAVKLKEAKFSLPVKEKGELTVDDKVKRRFVNLEGLDYAEEHDDITIGFDTEEERDKFAQALPAATSTGRGLSLRRRI